MKTIRSTIIIFFRRYTVILLLFFLTIIYVNGQPFLVDKYGYVKDTNFHQLIKQRGYEIVGAFEEINTSYKNDSTIRKLIKERGYEIAETTDTNTTYYKARVYYYGEWRYIDAYGELIPEYEKKQQDYTPEIRVISPEEYVDIEAPSFEEVKITAPNNDPYEIVDADGKSGTKHSITGKQGLKTIYNLLTIYGNGIIGIQKDGKRGMAYSNGKIIIEPLYEAVDPMGWHSSGYWDCSQFLVKKDGKYGVIDSLGRVVLKLEYNTISNHYTCANNKKVMIVGKNGKFGITNNKGKTIIAQQYDGVELFLGNLFKTKMGTPVKYGLVTCDGKILLDSQDNIKHDYYEGLITFEKNGLKGKMKPDGSIFLHQYYTSIEDVGDEGQDYFKVRKDGKYGLLNEKEEWIATPVYDNLYALHKRGLILVENKIGQLLHQVKQGFLDMKGNVVIAIEYDYIKPINDTLYFFENEKKYGLMDKKERVLTIFEYEKVISIGDYFEVRKDRKEGIMAIDGTLLLPIKYDFIKDGYDFYRRGYCKANLNGQYYWVDRYGNEVLMGMR